MSKPSMRPPRLGSLIASAGSLLLLLALAAAAGSTAFDTLSLDLKHRWVALSAGHSQPGVDLGPHVTASTSRPNPLGVNVFLEQEPDPAVRQRSLELLQAAGVGWIRQQLPWEQVEPTARGSDLDPTYGGSTWDKFDDIVDRANALGIQVVLRVDTSPRWALPAGASDGESPPVDPQDYWDFVTRVATRYRGRVLGYQIWNEPNLSIEWGGQPPNAADYDHLLAGAADRVHAADPNAVVLMAALAPTLTEDASAQSELVYLQQLYDIGIPSSVDALAVQAYGLRGGPDDPRIDRSDVTFSRPELVRQLMVRNGDAARPIWATEVGWNVNPPSMAVQRFGRVTPILQARYTARAFDRVAADWPWMQRLAVWYWKRPDETDRDQDWYWFRLADPGFQLQPVYFALRDFGRG
ncbi:MAG: cellulase family glycosylhydrolase [Chloroflexi bacterium]|nr:cellulase family glycosylhydrolase [Chloroflexota bacterium]